MVDAGPAAPTLANDHAGLTPRARAVLDRGATIYVHGRHRMADHVLDAIDPTSGTRTASIADGTAADVHAAVESAAAAFQAPSWRLMRAPDREVLLMRLADLIARDADLLAQIDAVDVGFPISIGRIVYGTFAAEVTRYMAGWPTKIKGEVADVGLPGGFAVTGMTLREPVGVVGAILPWNGPADAALWKIAPALAAGCTVVLKPSEMACLSVYALLDLVEEAGFPPGVVNVVAGRGPVVGAELVRHPGIAKVAFTGSTETGRRIQALAAEAPKKVHLELGGKSPVIVFPDADLDAAAAAICEGIFGYQGQVCVAGSRLVVHRDVRDGLLDRLLRAVETLRIGRTLDPETTFGPLVRRSHRDRVSRMVRAAIAGGATALCGGRPVDGPGCFYLPTILDGTAPDDPCQQEEIFGPVLTVTAFTGEDEAIRLANGTGYGLAAYLWTDSNARIQRLLPRLACGKVGVNMTAPPIASMPEGGVKQSGFGRDLGREGLDQYLVSKSVLVRG